MRRKSHYAAASGAIRRACLRAHIGTGDGCRDEVACAHAREVRFAKVRRFLEHYGYTLQRISGSHHIFGKPECPTISIPVHKGHVKPVYIRQIERTLGVSFE